MQAEAGSVTRAASSTTPLQPAPGQTDADRGRGDYRTRVRRRRGWMGKDKVVHQEAMLRSTSMASSFAGKLPRAAPGWAAPPHTHSPAAGGRRFKSDASSDEDVGSFQPAESKEAPPRPPGVQLALEPQGPAGAESASPGRGCV
ncbi:hypothetical protein KIL84_020868 [Mauremys mutica]|uniref:Uncharacterized protein n=1 Tax=Mauremys mutica TaxID=74926 RepID=A0A9D3X937_9SAUR|nr:hypothetical protein KIL84_020868 [Mauremys mutica]